MFKANYFSQRYFLKLDICRLRHDEFLKKTIPYPDIYW